MPVEEPEMPVDEVIDVVKLEDYFKNDPELYNRLEQAAKSVTPHTRRSRPQRV